MTNWFRNTVGLAGALCVCALLASATPAQAQVTISLVPVGNLNVPFTDTAYASGTANLGNAYTFRLMVTTDADIVGVEALNMAITSGTLVDVDGSLACTAGNSCVAGASGMDANRADTYLATPGDGAGGETGENGNGTLIGTNLSGALASMNFLGNGANLPIAVGDFPDDGAQTGWVLGQFTFEQSSPVVVQITGQVGTEDPGMPNQPIYTDFDFTIDTTAFDSDFTGNGTVDGDDLVQWSIGFATGTTRRQGDAGGGSGTPAVDGNDLVEWSIEFANGTNGTDMVTDNLAETVSALPEPASLALLGLGGLFLLRRRA